MSSDQPIITFDHIVQIDGVTACIGFIKEKGKFITIYGWRCDHYKFEVGQKIQVLSGEYRSSYKIINYRPCNDPHDMYFLDCEYIGPNTNP